MGNLSVSVRSIPIVLYPRFIRSLSPPWLVHAPHLDSGKLPRHPAFDDQSESIRFFPLGPPISVLKTLGVFDQSQKGQTL
jgi:hypothetical protein